MILFTDPSVVKDLKFGDAVIRYTEAPGDACVEAERACMNGTGELDATALNNKLIREHVVGWENVQNGKGETVEFSAESLAELLPLMTLSAKSQLRIAIQALYVEGVESGKD